MIVTSKSTASAYATRLAPRAPAIDGDGNEGGDELHGARRPGMRMRSAIARVRAQWRVTRSDASCSAWVKPLKISTI